MRRKLPSRRRQTVETIEFNNQAWRIGVGFDDAGAAREIFIEPEIRGVGDTVAASAGGTLLTSLAAELGMSLSARLQNGEALWRLLRFYGWVCRRERQRIPDWPSSMSIAVLRRAAMLQKIERGDMRQAAIVTRQVGEPGE